MIFFCTFIQKEGQKNEDNKNRDDNRNRIHTLSPFCKHTSLLGNKRNESGQKTKERSDAKKRKDREKDFYIGKTPPSFMIEDDHQMSFKTS